MIASLGLLLLVAAPAPAGSSPWRLEADPRDSAEAALRDAAIAEGAAATAGVLAVSQQFPATPSSGLGRLLAGLRLVEAGRAGEAIPHLTHPDVQLSLLRDHALLALGRAQEALGRADAAARSYLAAATEPASAVACVALPKAAELFARSRQLEAAVPALEQTVQSCPRGAAAALLDLGKTQLARGDRAAAAAAFDRLDREHPASPEAREARSRLVGLSGQLPPRGATERARLLLERGQALLAEGRTTEAIAALRAVPLPSLPPAEADLARVRLGRALLVRGSAEGRALLQKIPASSPHATEAAFQLARDRARRTRSPEAFEDVADRYPGTPWGEEALLSLANHSQKDALDEAALPWWRRLLAEYPSGRYVERAAWRVGWADYRARRYEAAAQVFEATARLRPPSGSTPGFLYWSARARVAMGQPDRARLLLAETVQRYKHAYHGVRAREALARLGGAPAAPASLVAVVPPPEPPLPEPRAGRLRQLLLIDRVAEVEQELRLLPESSPLVQATLAWAEWRQGQLRPAIIAMKRAYPEWVGEAGDRLPSEVWRILFPLRYDAQLRLSAQREGVDPALVAALVLQESSFDPAALSRAGARGLMQVMPGTGRRIARDKGQRFRRAVLHDPETSLDFGTRYLRQMSERFSGAVEKVLAAYNAGPERVEAWTALRGELAPEEFIESIPFTETRGYVTIVLGNREQYRRLYGLRPAPASASEGARP